MSLLIEAVIWLVAELFIQLAAEFLVGLGFGSAREAVAYSRRLHWMFAALGCVLIGGLTGLVVTLIYPHHVSPAVSLPYVAVIILPLIVGSLALWVGNRAERAGRERPALTTFWGGGLLAIGMSVTRFMILRSGWRPTGG